MTTLRQGDRSPAVRELQLLLLMTGHAPGPIDGIFGVKTQRAMVGAQGLLLGPGVGVHEGVLGEANDSEIAALRTLPRRAVEVPRVLTPASAVDARIALVAGYADVFATREVRAFPIRVALAQLCVEHGSEKWGGEQTKALAKAGLLPADWLRPHQGDMAYVAIWTNNLGNRQVSRADRAVAPYCFLRAREGIGASAKMLTSACHAYPNLAEGAAGYWRFLRDHCGPALAAFERGDPAVAAHELKVGQWHYSGDERAYAEAMVSRFRTIG